MVEKRADVLIEVSWEACNKVGGIFTVLSSKALQMVNKYGENYYAIGPYFATQALGQFEETVAPQMFKALTEELKKEGIILRFGKWLVKGEPNAILVDFHSFMQYGDGIKKFLWDHFGISSIRASYDYTEPIVWGWAVGKLIEKLKGCFGDKKVVAHFHEWLAGSALLYLKKQNVKVGKVFTTHATILGRTLASNDIDLYNQLKTVKPEQEAYKYSIEAKYGIEKMSAFNADVFTTVSEITGLEAEYLIGRKPDVLVLNGLDMEKFPTFEECAIKHLQYREKMKEFILYYFYPYYYFDLENTLIFFLAGRYEFRDKGVDVYIKALGKLNDALKKKKESMNVVAFVFIPGAIRGIKHELLENREFYFDLRETVDDEMPEIRRHIIRNIVAQQQLSKQTLFDQEFLDETKRKVLSLRRKGMPALSTHDLLDQNDIIVRTLNQFGVDNAEDDRVKIIFYPTYLTGHDGLLDLNYYETIQACHLGVFPSFYEPWGYTPLETAALGVSSVTTDLAGFGLYIAKELKTERTPGIFVLKRMNKSDDEIIESLANFMYDFVHFSKHERIANKQIAKNLSKLADWGLLIDNYINAHNIAADRNG